MYMTQTVCVFLDRQPQHGRPLKIFFYIIFIFKHKIIPAL